MWYINSHKIDIDETFIKITQSDKLIEIIESKIPARITVSTEGYGHRGQNSQVHQDKFQSTRTFPICVDQTKMSDQYVVYCWPHFKKQLE